MTKMTSRSKAFVAACVIGLSTACTVGPNYKKPNVPVPPEYRGAPAEQGGKSDVRSFGDQKWWDAFQDDALRDLIKTALQQNYDVRIAAARIVQARAQLGITRADQFPQASASAAAISERIPQSTRLPAIDTSAGTVSASAAWELDFWGRYRRATESAR